MNRDELKLQGLKLLANDYLSRVKDIAIEAKKITEDFEEYSHTDDWIYDPNDSRTAAELIARLKEKK